MTRSGFVSDAMMNANMTQYVRYFVVYIYRKTGEE